MTQSEFGKLLASAMQEMGTKKTMQYMAGFMLAVFKLHQEEGYITDDTVTFESKTGKVTLEINQAANKMDYEQ